MLSRVAACWLVVLVLAPFTAPFPTCDLVTLFGGAPAHHTPMNMPASATLGSDAVDVSVPAAPRTGRIRLLPLSSVLASANVRFSASATRPQPAALAGRLCARAVLTTNLRV
jgi:hypothetical protein